MPAEQECQTFVGQTENIYALDEHGKQYAFEVIVTHVCSEMKNHPMPHQCGECGEAWGYLDAPTEEDTQHKAIQEMMDAAQREAQPDLDAIVESHKTPLRGHWAEKDNK